MRRHQLLPAAATAAVSSLAGCADTTLPGPTNLRPEEGLLGRSLVGETTEIPELPWTN